MAPSIDEFEDLTQFADESFDTEGVDLFEFSEDEDSPLLRLKSIVLSLDWDITEEILTELNEELASLRAMWKDDKVAQIYLQGMENVGKYMQAEGAYAHPNAIKLLLTLYHNYEKIISSPNISGESITAMLKADIRKFKVLQYQISALKSTRSEGREELTAVAPEKPSAAAGRPAAAPAASSPAAAQDSAVPGPLRSMEATILGLEWEVTDEGLEKFNKESAELRSHLSGNKEAQVLIQGLQALGSYIREQKTNAHPDSFTILHSFYDALKMLLESPQLGPEQRRDILLEQIGSLNSLKEVIARAAAAPKEPEPAAVEEDEEESPIAKAEEEPVFPAEEAAEEEEDRLDSGFSFDDEEEEAPAAVLFKPEAPVKPAADSGDDDDEFGDDLFSSGSGVVPALADAEEEGGFGGSVAAAGLSPDREAELDEKLDSFFNFDDELPEAKPPQAAAAAKPSLAHVLDDAPEEDEDDNAELDSSFFNFDDELDDGPAEKAAAGGKDPVLNFDDDSSFAAEEEAPPLPTAGKQRLSAAAEQAEEDEEDDELDSFFNFDDELDEPPLQKTKAKPPAASVVFKQDEVSFADDSLLDEDEEEAGSPAAALADEAEPPAEEKEEDELGSDFDSFFSFDEEEKGNVEPPAASAVSAQDKVSFTDSLLDEDEEEAGSPAAALADETEPPAEEKEEDELGSDFDSFFSFDEEKKEHAETQQQNEPVEPEIGSENAAEIKSKLDSLFSFEEDALGHSEVTAGLQDDTPDLDDAFITPLDEELSELPDKVVHEELGADNAAAAEGAEEPFFSVGRENEAFDAEPEEDASAEDEPFGLTGADELEETASSASLAAEDGEDSFFSFDSGMDDAKEAAAPEFTAEAGEEDGIIAAAEGAEEPFFSVGRENEAFDAEPEEDASAEDEPFGLTEEAGEELLLDKEYEAESQALFFGQDDLPDPFVSRAEPAEEESAAAAADTGGSPAEAAVSLAAAVAALSAAPAAAELRQVADLAAAARSETPPSAPQSVVLNLLAAAAALLLQAPDGGAGGGAILQDLAAAVERAEEPEVLAGAVSRYTAWQQELVAGLLRRRPQLPEEMAPEDGLGLVREEFSRLKQELLTEFSQLRKELMTLRN